MKKMLIGLAAVSLLGSCTQTQGWFGGNSAADSTEKLQTEGAHNARLERDESITRENAFSDLFLDSATIDSFLTKEKMAGDEAERMRAFYRVRANQFAWFTSAGVTESARGLWSLAAAEEGKKDAPTDDLKERMDSLLLNDSVAFSPADTALVRTELALTAQLVKLSEEANGVVTADNFYWLVPRKKMDAMQLADSLLTKQPDSTVGAGNRHYAALKENLKLYYNAAKAGGWQPVQKAALKKGAKSPAVTLLKKRLAATGDYPAADTSNVFTDSLATAIRAVQEQYGMTPTGRLTDSLVTELNVPAAERLQQLLVNMNRALWMKPLTDSPHISVNIPSLQLVVYTDSGKGMEMPVVVGKEGTGTMAFSGAVSTVVFSPYWNIPKSIVRTEIKPEMDKDPAYLKKKNMEVVKQDDSLPQLRQLPGKDNPLGRVKFLFPNRFDIYLHDTPAKDQFAQQNRALSHGCIRVAKPDSLAAFVLRGQSDWTPQKIAAAMNGDKEQKVEVKNRVPVVISYYTAFVDEKGRMNFRPDVYGYDKKAAQKMFTGSI